MTCVSIYDCCIWRHSRPLVLRGHGRLLLLHRLVQLLLLYYVGLTSTTWSCTIASATWAHMAAATAWALLLLGHLRLFFVHGPVRQLLQHDYFNRPCMTAPTAWLHGYCSYYKAMYDYSYYVAMHDYHYMNMYSTCYRLLLVHGHLRVLLLV